MSLGISGGELLHNDDGPSTAVDTAGRAKYIIDSGTSNLVIRKPTYRAIVAALAGALGDSAPPPTHGFWNSSACAKVDLALLPPLIFRLRAEDGDQEDTVLQIPAQRYDPRTQGQHYAATRPAAENLEPNPKPKPDTYSLTRIRT